MAFDPNQYSIEEWLQIEGNNLLQKICNTVNVDGQLIEQWKTRVTIVPTGNTIPHGSGRGRKFTGAAAALYRAFSYDAGGNRISSLPEMKEWTQVCENRAEGADATPQDPFIGSGSGGGLPFAWDSFLIDRTDPTDDVYTYSLDVTQTGTVTLVYTAIDKCTLQGATIVVL